MPEFHQYYQQELNNLRELAVQFSKAHPALAPMLSGQTSDPDVERLLEGTAFLSGLLRQKIEDEFPEIVNGLTDLIFPDYLHPVPSTTMIAFTPKPNLKETITVPAGIQIDSSPVDETPCTFSTCFSMEIHPLEIIEAGFQEKPIGSNRIRLLLQLNGMKLSSWSPGYLRFYLGGNYPNAANLFYILNRYVKNIVLSPVTDGNKCILPSESIVASGFNLKESLLPHSTQSFPGYGFLSSYFLLPQSFLFIDIRGFEKWAEKGDGSRFEINFELEKIPIPLPSITGESFKLFVSPAINLFKHEAEPFMINHKKAEYLIRPYQGADGQYDVYSVDKVTGIVQGTVEQREYVSFDMFGQQEKNRPVYATARRKSPISQKQQVCLLLTYPASIDIPAQETASIELTCTNGMLPERLQLGDISKPTSTSPELMTFKNIITPTSICYPPVGSNMLWHFLSHLAVNYLSIGRVDTLKEILSLYMFPEGRDRARIAANTKRVEGIVDLKITDKDRLVSGYMMRGREIQMKLSSDHFASTGDMFLFSTVMDYFFAVYSSMNCFTRLIVEETITGEKYIWKPRIGDRFLV